MRDHNDRLMVGIDICDLSRFSAYAKNPAFLSRIFSERELRWLAKRDMSAALCAEGFAAKEAFLKAIGTGILAPDHLPAVSVVRDSAGFRCRIELDASVKEIFGRLGYRRIHLSVCHDAETAYALVAVE